MPPQTPTAGIQPLTIAAVIAFAVLVVVAVGVAVYFKTKKTETVGSLGPQK